MRYFTQNQVDYAKFQDYLDDKDDYSVATAKKYISELLTANRKLHDVAGRTAATVIQYRNLLKFVDHTLDQDKHLEKMKEQRKQDEEQNKVPDFRQELVLIICHLLGSVNSVFFWVYMMVEGMTAHFAFTPEDMDFKNVLCELGNMAQDLLNASEKRCNYSIPNIKNLEKWKKEIARKKDKSQNDAERGEEASKSILDDKNTLQDDDAQCGEEPIKFTLENQNVLENGGAKCVEEQDTSIVEMSSNTSENELYRGGENECVGNGNEVTCERPVKRTEKTLRISSKELFKNGVVEDANIYKNISVTCNESPCSSTLDHPTRTYKNYINRDEREILQNASVTSTSKGPRSHKRKYLQNTHEGYVNKNYMNENENSMPQNSVPVPKRHRLGRNRYSDTHEINVNGIDEKRINTLQNFMSKRSCRSNKYNSSSVHENDFNENGPRRSYKKLKANLSATSEAKTEGEMSHVKPKKEGELNQKNLNRRGRKKKNVMHHQEINENFKTSNKNKNILSVEDVPNYYSSSFKNSIKTAYVALNNVLDDPDAQHYLDVIKCNEKKKKEDVARYRERNEMEDANLNKDRNDMVVETWSVVDDIRDTLEEEVVDDDDDNECHNIEGTGRLCNDDRLESDSNIDQKHRLESDSNIDQKHMLSEADTEQHKNDDSDRESDDCSCRKEIEDRSFHMEQVDMSNNNNSGDGKTKVGPGTPPGSPPSVSSPPGSSPDGSSPDGLSPESPDDMHPSATSDEDDSIGFEDRNGSNASSEPSDDGKKDPQTSSQRTPTGPHTPPGQPPVSDAEDSNSPE